MALSLSKLRSGLIAAARNSDPASGSVAMAKAYADYAASAQCCAGGMVSTADFGARKKLLRTALLVSASAPAAGPQYAFQVMAAGFTAFWLAPPATFPGPGAVTIAIPATLYAALLAGMLPQVAVAAAGGHPPGPTIMAGILDTWTRTIIAAVPTAPCVGPLT